MGTLSEDIAELADDGAVMRAVGALTDRGINGVMFEKLMAITTKVDPFAGWTMANVGCYWSRELPDGRRAHLSTWQTGYGEASRSGYALTVDFERTDYDTLDDALAAFEEMTWPAK